MSNVGIVQPLAGGFDGDASALGGKAASMVRLRRTGFPVPDGFVLTTDAYWAFLRRTGLEARLSEALEFDADDPEAVAAAGERARDLIRDADLPAEHVEAIEGAYDDLGEGPVAVRSSATDEDGSEASFAGQQETYLNVEGTEAVLERVKHCWASLFTDRALAYRADRGLGHGEVGMAVIVQELVDADKSGVMFTVDPATGAEEMTVEAAWGLGEAVVSGTVTPDNYVIDRESGEISEQTVATKRVMYTRAPDGETVERPVPDDRQDERVLSREELDRLADVGRRIEAERDRPQDIEWAIEDGDLIVLQARPITTVGAASTPEAGPGPAGTSVEGLGAAPGTGTGELCFDAITAVKRADDGHDVVLARERTCPSDVPGMKAAEAVLTAEGGTTSHAAIVARELDTPAVVGCDRFEVAEEAGHAEVDGRTLEAGTRVRVDGTAGEVTILE